jgi:hypothetical protein
VHRVRDAGVNVDLNTVLMAGLGLACGLLGWLGRELWNAVQSLRKDLSSLEVRIGTDYVRYDRLQDALKPLMEKLDKIADALNHKADKP